MSLGIQSPSDNGNGTSIPCLGGDCTPQLFIKNQKNNPQSLDGSPKRSKQPNHQNRPGFWIPKAREGLTVYNHLLIKSIYRFHCHSQKEHARIPKEKSLLPVFQSRFFQLLVSSYFSSTNFFLQIKVYILPWNLTWNLNMEGLEDDCSFELGDFRGVTAP